MIKDNLLKDSIDILNKIKTEIPNKSDYINNYSYSVGYETLVFQINYIVARSNLADNYDSFYSWISKIVNKNSVLVTCSFTYEIELHPFLYDKLKSIL